MYDEINIISDSDNGDYVPVVPSYLRDMEIESTDGEETQSEEIQSDESSELNSDEQTGEGSTGEDSAIDYSDILLSIDGRLENVETSLSNIETNQLDIVNNTEANTLLVDNFQKSFLGFTLSVLVFVVIFAIYHWLDNFIK